MKRNAIPQLRPYLVMGLMFVLAMASSALAQSANEEAVIMTSLKSGNDRFVSGKAQPKDYLAERLKVVKEQHPYAIVLACSDSRVPPEIVFDESIGKLFVVRTAGHVVDPVALGSIEYAVEHLHVHMLFVLGHESCGAVKATIGGGEAPVNIRSLLQRIRPAVDKAHVAELSATEELKNAIIENVRYQMQMAVYESDVLSDAVKKGHLTIVGGVYNLGSGKVDLVSTLLAVDHNANGGGTDHLAGSRASGPASHAPAVKIQAASHAPDAHSAGTQPGPHLPAEQGGHKEPMHENKGGSHAEAEPRENAADHNQGHGQKPHSVPAKSHAAGASHKVTHAAVKAHGHTATTHKASGHKASRKPGHTAAKGHSTGKTTQSAAKSHAATGKTHTGAEKGHKSAGTSEQSSEKPAKKASPAAGSRKVAEKSGSSDKKSSSIEKSSRSADKEPSSGEKSHRSDRSHATGESSGDDQASFNGFEGMNWTIMFSDEVGKMATAEAISQFFKQISELRMSKILTSW